MKNPQILIAFILWLLISGFFVFSVIGLLMFVPKDRWENVEHTPSTWYTIGKRLLEALLKND